MILVGSAQESIWKARLEPNLSYLDASQDTELVNWHSTQVHILGISENVIEYRFCNTLSAYCTPLHRAPSSQARWRGASGYTD